MYSLGSRVIEKKAYIFLLATSLRLHYTSFNYNEVGLHRVLCLKGLNFLFNGNWGVIIDPEMLCDFQQNSFFLAVKSINPLSNLII